MTKSKEFTDALNRTELLEQEFKTLIPNYEEEITCLFGSLFCMLTIMLQLEVDKDINE